MIFQIVIGVGIALLILVIGLGLYIRWQASIPPLPYDVYFEVRRDEDVWIERGENGALLFRWQDHLTPVSIRGGESVETINHDIRVARKNEGNSAAVTDLDPGTRYLFDVGFENGARQYVAERILPLGHTANFRDFGGYMTSEGKQVRWGLLYRSDGLDRLNENDHAYLDRLGVKTVCDLRSYKEVDDRPDSLPAEMMHHHIPIFDHDPIGAKNVIFRRHKLGDIFENLYREFIVDGGAKQFQTLFSLILDGDNLPLLYHCTGGKDRTGIASALLLYTLGVPEEQIVNDYTLTNLMAPRFIRGLKKEYSATPNPVGVKIEQLYALLAAPPFLLERTFDYIRVRYGSVDAYIRDAVGLTDEEITRLKEMLLY